MPGVYVPARDNKEDLLARLNKRTNKTDTCWLWTGANKSGYGVISLWKFSPLFKVHRLSAYIFHNLDLDNKDHLALHKPICPNRNCWNPEHIYVGDSRDNVHDSLITRTHIAPSKFKTHCDKGHELDGLRSNGKRYCKTCNRERAGYF